MELHYVDPNITVSDESKAIVKEGIEIEEKEKTSLNDKEDDSATSTQGKVDILFKATGNAPILKRKKWRVDENKELGAIHEFLRKYLKLDEFESLFLYVHQSFSPSPDTIVRNLYECFGSDGMLVIHYCKNPAWG